MQCLRQSVPLDWMTSLGATSASVHTFTWAAVQFTYPFVGGDCKTAKQEETRKWCEPFPWWPGLGFHKGNSIQGKVKMVGWAYPSCSANLPRPQTKLKYLLLLGLLFSESSNETFLGSRVFRRIVLFHFPPTYFISGGLNSCAFKCLEISERKLPSSTHVTACCCLFTKLCLTLCNPMDCGPPGSSVYGIFQARILEWVAISFFRGSTWTRDQTHIFCITGTFFTSELPGKPAWLLIYG